MGPPGHGYPWDGGVEAALAEMPARSSIAPEIPPEPVDGKTIDLGSRTSLWRWVIAGDSPIGDPFRG